MAFYRITIVMADRSRGRCLGIFANAFEAIAQTLAHFPDATSVSAIHIHGSRA